MVVVGYVGDRIKDEGERRATGGMVELREEHWRRRDGRWKQNKSKFCQVYEIN